MSVVGEWVLNCFLGVLCRGRVDRFTFNALGFCWCFLFFFSWLLFWGLLVGVFCCFGL